VQNKIKLLHLITGLGCGGAEKMVYQLCKYHDRNKFDISVISLDNTDYFIPKFKSLNLKIISLGIDKSSFSFIKGVLWLNKFISQNKIQIIHAHLFHAMIMACIVKVYKPSLKIIWTGHNSKMISIWRSIITFVSRYARDHDILLQKQLKLWYNSSIISIIPNGIEFPEEYQSAQKFNNFTFISVGSLEKQKNHIFLIELFYKIKNSTLNLNILGNGSEYKYLQSRIDTLGLSERVKLLGHREDVHELMQQSHCFLLPSLWEGLPLVILECAQVKIPIIASSIISIRDLISEDEGYVVPLEQFETAINRVIENYSDASKKANKFYNRVKQDYSIETCIQKHEHLYEMVLNV